MKKLILTFTALSVLILTGIIINSCKEDFPEEHIGLSNKINLTLEVDSISYDFSDLNVTLSFLPKESDIEYGICWDTVTLPTIEKNKTTNTYLEEKDYANKAINLVPVSNYYIRAYLKYANIYFYSNQEQITTLKPSPEAQIKEIFAVTDKTAKVKSNVTTPERFEVTERGVCYGTKNNPTLVDDITTDDKGNGEFESSIKSLQLGTKYYVRAYAINAYDTAYSLEKNFITIDGAAAVSTNTLTQITSNSATCGGNISDDGGLSITARGVCWSTNQTPTINNDKTTDDNGIGTFTSSITDLEAEQTYFVRAYATNSSDTYYGDQEEFETLPLAPASFISVTSPNGGEDWESGSSHEITWDDNIDEPVSIQLWKATTLARTIVASTESDGSFTWNIANEYEVAVDYKVRIISTTDENTYDECDENFSISKAIEETLTDFDGNSYKTVTIGDQVWMAENLKTTHYPSGTEITLVTDNIAWANLEDNDTDMAYCYYNNNANNEKDTFGALYTYAAAKEACPSGWHLPSTIEWTTLISNVSNDGHAGSEGTALKSTTGWLDNGNGTDVYGFSALAGGQRWFNIDDNFWGKGNNGIWWTNTQSDQTNAYYYFILDRSDKVNNAILNKSYGYSVRCLKGDPPTQTPTLTTTATTDITSSTATSGGTITNDGGATITTSGVCYATTQSPTINDNVTTDGSATGSFTSSITGLSASTTYYVRAYATNSVGTAYGSETSFTTSSTAGIPTVTTTTVSSITSTTATSGGTINSDGGADITASGICYAKTQNPTTNDTIISNGTTTGSFTSSMTGLTTGITYYVRAYATNSEGTAYGGEVSFATTLKVGDSYQGGVVAYLFHAGEPSYIAGELHGLIAAEGDQSAFEEWGCWNTLITGADNTIIGTGNQNTIDIVAGCTSMGIAARHCSDLVLSGYEDWYLPSRDELNILYINRVAIGGFSTGLYWSSTEYNSDASWAQDFSNGYQYEESLKSDTYNVRAIRTF
ncbi:MAG: FISUMP domain-containing protein [Salinivirgaceae bacterium]|jgi:uncharacterized protein (TIGR02145 family)|nr:FISUMP domain-containing protein [Salinivirgaceae bacterium]